jgi:hypothetical protein
MAKKKKKWLTKDEERKLRAEVNAALKIAEDLVLDLTKIKKGMMSPFPPPPPFSYCPPHLKRQRR